MSSWWRRSALPGSTGLGLREEDRLAACTCVAEPEPFRQPPWDTRSVCHVPVPMVVLADTRAPWVTMFWGESQLTRQPSAVDVLVFGIENCFFKHSQENDSCNPELDS